MAYEVSKIEDKELQEEIGRKAAQEKITAADVKQTVSIRKPQPMTPSVTQSRALKSVEPITLTHEYHDINGCVITLTIPADVAGPGL